MLGFITNTDVSEYRDQVDKFITWCMETNVELKVDKTKEIIVDLRRKKYSPISPLLIDGRTMGFHKSTLVARGANTQLDPSCVSAPPATNMDLFASSFAC